MNWAKPLRPGVAAFLVALILGGCCTCPKANDPIPRGAPPPLATVTVAYNARVEHLDRLWSDATVRFQSVDSDGNEIDEQGDGYIQIIRPRKLYLTVGKVGEVGYQLGSSDTKYWWIDVRKRSAIFGEHQKFTPEIGERAGLPVHPLDLMEVLAIVPLGTSGEDQALSWSADGRDLLLRTRRTSGERVIALDPDSYLPREVQLLDGDGEVIVQALLTDPIAVRMSDSKVAPSRSPSRFEVKVPSTQTTLTLWLKNLENRGAAIKDQAFDFDVLCKVYRVEESHAIDGPPPGPKNEP